MNKEELRVELEKFAKWYAEKPAIKTGLMNNIGWQDVVDNYINSIEKEQPELKGISEAFQNFTNELKSMGL